MWKNSLIIYVAMSKVWLNFLNVTDFDFETLDFFNINFAEPFKPHFVEWPPSLPPLTLAPQAKTIVNTVLESSQKFKFSTLTAVNCWNLQMAEFCEFVQIWARKVLKISVGSSSWNFSMLVNPRQTIIRHDKP